MLLSELKRHVQIPQDVAEVVELSDYAVQVRYPGDYAPVDEQEYTRAVEIAQRVLHWVWGQIYEADSAESLGGASSADDVDSMTDTECQES